MVRIRIFSEVSLEAAMDLEGVDSRTRDYDVQQHRKEIHDYLQKRLSAAFGDADNLKLHYFEFSVAGD